MRFRRPCVKVTKVQSSNNKVSFPVASTEQFWKLDQQYFSCGGDYVPYDKRR